MNNLGATTIRLSKITKCYTIHHEKSAMTKKVAASWDDEFWALKNISLTIRKGERVGIIGPNGYPPHSTVGYNE